MRNEIYPAMWVQSHDYEAQHMPTLLIPNYPESDPSTRRNTYDLRVRAYAYFNDVFGIAFDPTMDGVQASSTIPDLTVTPLAMDLVKAPYRILAFNDMEHRLKTLKPSTSSKSMPVTNAVIDDIVYMVAKTARRCSPVTVTNQQTGEVSTFTNGSALVYGTYRIVVDGVAATDDETDIHYFSEATFAMNGGLPALDCTLQSSLWGMGKAFGFGGIDPVTNRAIFRTVVSFPASFTDPAAGDRSSDKRYQCENLKMEKSGKRRHSKYWHRH